MTGIYFWCFVRCNFCSDKNRSHCGVWHSTGHLGELSLSSLRGRHIDYRPVWLWLRRGVFTCVGWQVTLC